MRKSNGAIAAAGLLVAASCVSNPDDGGGTIRLVDLFGEAQVRDSPASVEVPEPLEWQFGEAGADSNPGWQADGVEDFAMRRGALRGRSTSETPILWVSHPDGEGPEDLLHAVEVVARVSEGTELAVRFDSGDEPDIERVRDSPFPWRLSTPLLSGEESQKYTIRPTRPVHLTSFRHLLLRPTDVQGAKFEVESVRVVSRREHLARIESGVGWHGMDDVFRESIVTRAPARRRRFRAHSSPNGPWLDLGLAYDRGTAPATFRDRGADATIGESDGRLRAHDDSKPHRWNTGTRLSLDSLAGRRRHVVAVAYDSEQGGDARVLGHGGRTRRGVVRHGDASGDAAGRDRAARRHSPRRSRRARSATSVRNDARTSSQLAAEGVAGPRQRLAGARGPRSR